MQGQMRLLHRNLSKWTVLKRKYIKSAITHFFLNVIYKNYEKQSAKIKSLIEDKKKLIEELRIQRERK